MSRACHRAAGSPKCKEKKGEIIRKISKMNFSCIHSGYSKKFNIRATQMCKIHPSSGSSKGDDVTAFFGRRVTSYLHWQDILGHFSKNAISCGDTNQWYFFPPYHQDHECRRRESGNSIVGRKRREETSDRITMVPAHHSNVSSACWTVDISYHLSLHAWGILPYFTQDVGWLLMNLQAHS